MALGLFDKGDPQGAFADLVLTDYFERAAGLIDAIGGEAAWGLADRIDEAPARVQFEETRRRLGGIVAHDGQRAVVADGKVRERVVPAVRTEEELPCASEQVGKEWA